MSEEERDSESDVIEKAVQSPISKGPNFFEKQFIRVKEEPLQFLLQILVWFVPAYIYYIVADEFVRQSLLNLT